MKQMPMLERHEVFLTMTSRGEPLFWGVDEYGHVAPLGEGGGLAPNRENGSRDA